MRLGEGHRLLSAPPADGTGEIGQEGLIRRWQFVVRWPETHRQNLCQQNPCQQNLEARISTPRFNCERLVIQSSRHDLLTMYNGVQFRE
jgi:hypothetical protein